MYRFIRLRMTLALGALAAVLLFAPPDLAAQGGSITGRVSDSQTGNPVAAAQVFIAELDLGGLTRQNGSYLLLNVPIGTHTLTVQRIGYRTVTVQLSVAAGETMAQDFQITEEALSLDEIIVTGTPGGTQRRAIGNTVTTVDVSDIVQNVAISNMQDLLSGRTPGLQFARLSGNVGTGSPITIRGVGSFSFTRNQPLVYVDGVRVNNDPEAGPNLGSGDNVNVLDDFNPEDIESIEIIKGPAAASLYGTEASAGVIQIITKKGREGAPQFNFSIKQGTNYLRNPAGRLGDMFTCPTDPSPGPTDCSTEAELAGYNMYNEANRYIREGYFPWPTENLYQNGLNQSYNVDVRGGTQSIRYFLSANYEEEEGIVWYNKDETFRIRGNVGVVFSDKFSLDMSTGFVDGYTRFAAPTISDGGLWQDLLWSNGFYLDRINPFDGSKSSRANARLGGFQEHLPSDVADIEATRDYTRFTGSATLNFQSGDFGFAGITSSLTQRLVVGIDKGWDTNRNLFPLEAGPVPENLTDFKDTWASVYSETVDGTMVYERPVQTNLSFDYSLTLDTDVSDAWGLKSSFGAQYYADEQDFFASNGTGFASPLSTTINQLSPSTITTRYALVQNRSLGFYVQEEVSWNGRIFVVGAMRFDDNSTFGVDAPAQKYPKVSGTWVVSEESFWNFDLLNSLRVRGAWGQAGRQPSATSGQNIYRAIPGPGGTAAIRPSSPGNPGIKPEVSTELELGFDAALFDDRISAEVTHYWRKDEDALLSIAIPSSFGFPGSVSTNLGRIDNWGWEAIVGARVYENSAFSFDLDLAADYTNNKIISLGAYPGTTRIALGLPYPNHNEGDIVVAARFDPDGDRRNPFGQSMSAECDEGISLAPEGAADPEKWGRIEGGAILPCGDIPNQNIYVGRSFFTNTFSVAPRISLLGNQLQFFALAEGKYGKTHTDNGGQWGHVYNNTKASRLENDPIWSYSDELNPGGQFTRTKTYFDADFWKLREVGARFTLPQAWIEGMGASRASLAVSARNLWTIWQRQDNIYGQSIADPEYGTSSLSGTSNYWETPPLTSLNLTLRVTF